MTHHNQLTATQCKALGPGKHADGRGLWLFVSGAGGRSWVYRYNVAKKRREMGLGPFPAVSLAEARTTRDKWAELLRAGKDPKAVRDAEQARAAAPGRTLADVVNGKLDALRPTLRDGGEAGRWLSPLKVHVLPKLGKMDVEQITSQDIANTLRPIWHSKPSAAIKAFRRLSMSLEHGAALGFDVDLGAARKARILLGAQDHKETHIPAMPWQDVPTFYGTLTGGSTSELALRLLILTGVRSRPIRYAHASQFDGAVWTVPGEGEGARQKGKKGKVEDFRVPLSAEAQAVAAKALEASRDGFLFPGASKGVISDMTLSALMKRRGLVARPHGFRSSFRTWAAENGVAEHVAELCLSHSIGTKVSQAYRRTDQLDARRNVMEAWGRFAATGIEWKNTVAYLR